MAYPYTSPTSSQDRPTEKLTPSRQGSVSAFGSSSTRIGHAPPPSSSMFSQEDHDAALEPSRKTGAKKAPTIIPGSAESVENDQLDRWITVFGFPASHSSIILSYFHNFGQILRIKHSENGGNWIHLLYMTKLQAEKALGKNGKILDSGNIMIGVIKCTDPSVISDRVIAPTPSKKLNSEMASFSATVPYVCTH